MVKKNKDEELIACPKLSAWERGMKAAFPPSIIEKMEERGTIRRCGEPEELEVEESKEGSEEK